MQPVTIIKRGHGEKDNRNFGLTASGRRASEKDGTSTLKKLRTKVNAPIFAAKVANGSVRCGASFLFGA